MNSSPNTVCVMRFPYHLEATHQIPNFTARLQADQTSVSLHILTQSAAPVGPGPELLIEMSKDTAAKLAIEILRAFPEADRHALDPVGYDEKTGKFYLWDTKDLCTAVVPSAPIQTAEEIKEPLMQPEPGLATALSADNTRLRHKVMELQEALRGVCRITADHLTK
jgi:hypothetical protein